MALMKTSNPALGKDTFSQFGRTIDAADRMTLNGTVDKTGILLLCVVATATFVWHQFFPMRDIADVAPWMMLGVIGGFVMALITIFKREWSPVTAPLYALCEGLALGGISAVFDLKYPGIAMQAVGLTFGTLFVLLLVYRSGLIKVTDKFRMGVIAATGGVAIFYVLEMVLSMFFHFQFTAINGSGAIGIGFSLLVVGIAALNLILDFDFIEQGVQYGAPKYMEWYGAFGIVVTLVWLYLEMLNLLSKMRNR